MMFLVMDPAIMISRNCIIHLHDLCWYLAKAAHLANILQVFVQSIKINKQATAFKHSTLHGDLTCETHREGGSWRTFKIFFC